MEFSGIFHRRCSSSGKATSPANATPITYNLVDVTATFAGVTDNLTGSFTYDPTIIGSNGGETAANITVSGTFDPGTYNALSVGVGRTLSTSSSR